MYNGSLLRLALVTVASIIVTDYNLGTIHEKLFLPSKWNPAQEYDYIIIGGGTAGCVIAGRLANTTERLKVLVIEEGYFPYINNDIPAMDLLNILPPTDNLNEFLVEKQNSASFGFPNHQFTTVTAKILGGGSGVNGMMYNRGGKDDYYGWARDYEAYGWSYENVLRLFKKAENQTDPALIKESFYHSTGGPVSVSSTNISQAEPPYQRLSNIIVDAAKEKGYNETDINGAHQIGTTRIQRTIKRGRRASTATAYLEPLINYENLVILTKARVTKIIFEGKRATGVLFDYQGQSQTARVNTKGEIIVSAGAINSPKLLQLSGVGPKSLLESLEIPLVADLPVGLSFQDHARVAGVDFVCNQTLFSYWEDLLTLQNLETFYKNGDGPLASQFYLHQGAVINIRTSVPDRGLLFGPSDVMMAPALLPPGSILLTAGQPLLNDEIMTKYFGPFFGQPTLNIFTALNYVRSRGFVQIKSTNPYDNPLVNPNYLSDGDDLARVVEAYRFGMSLEYTKAFKNMGCRPYNIPLPGCEHLFNNYTTFQSDYYIRCKVMHLTASELHPSGSCKMSGIENDQTAVVDPRLRIIGLTGIRVADASIMPSVASGNLMAPCIMIGEHAAELILEDRAKLNHY